ncbi:MAG TPA: gamma-glutamylcyclotransferase family protein [Alphaproteobacteria bacterium]|jgi:hypothetical protein
MPPPTERPRAARDEAAGFDFFFYGTLCDPEVRALVFGRKADVVPAILDDYEAVPVERGRFPMLLFQRGSAAAGVLCRGIGLIEAARLGFYEREGRDYGARKLAVRVEGGQGGEPHPAWVFLPIGALRRGPGRWDLAEWQRYAKRDFLARWTRAMRAVEPKDLEPFIELWRARMAPNA